MAVITATRNNVAAVNNTQYLHNVYRVASQLLPGMLAIIDSNGFVIPTASAPAAGVSIYGIAMMRRDPGGQPVELFQQGWISGWDLSGLSRGALVYAGASGELDTAGNVIVGEVVALGYSGEKFLYIDVTRTWMVA